MNTTVIHDSDWDYERLAWRIGLTPIHIIGIITSIYRIARRYKTRQSGLDDYAATLTLILDLIFFPTLWLRNGDTCQVPGTPGGPWTEEDSLPPKFQTRMVQVTIGWLVQVVYPLLTWSAKSSLALTIARLIPPSHPTHAASIIVACLSTFAGLGIVIQTCIYCAKVDNLWTHQPPYRCKVTAAAGSIRLGSEVVIDMCLIIIPFYAFFWPLPSSNNPAPNNNNNNNNPTPQVRLRLRLPPVTRRLIKVCFTASILTTSTAIVNMILLFKTKNSESIKIRLRTGYMAFVLSHLTASVSLLVCNLLIVITSLYRILRTQMETPRVVEVGKSPVIPTLSNRVNSGSGPIDGSSNAASGEREGERVTTTGNMSENFSGGESSGTDGRRATRTLTSTDSSYHVEFTELFESETSEFQRSSQY